MHGAPSPATENVALQYNDHLLQLQQQDAIQSETARVAARGANSRAESLALEL